MSLLSEQLPLAVQLRDDATFKNFYVGDNGLLLNSLQQQTQGGERYIYLYGKKGSGRSHLLQAACHKVESTGLSCAFLPLQELKEHPPSDVLEGLEQLSLVCLDDIDCVITSPEWQQALFHLFNRLKDNNITLLITASCAVRELDCSLVDLVSRLSWGAVFQIKYLTDQQRGAVIQMRADRRGLQLANEVAQFIYNRCQRDTESLLNVLDTLDTASLKEQRHLTVPFVKQIMGW